MSILLAFLLHSGWKIDMKPADEAYYSYFDGQNILPCYKVDANAVLCQTGTKSATFFFTRGQNET